METNRFTQNELLDKAIFELEVQRNHQKLVLKNQMNVTLNSLNPFALIKQSYTEMKDDPDLKKKIIQAAVSFAAGLLSKKLLIGNTNSTFKNILGYLIQFGVTKFIAKEVTNKP